MGDGPADDIEAAASDRSVRAQALVVAGLSTLSAALAAYEIAPASVTPLIRDALAIDATRAGLLVSVMFGVAVVASLPAGAVLDRTNSRFALALTVGAVLVAGVWGWVAAERGNYYSLLASRVLGGVVFVVVWNAGIDIVSRAVTVDRRATAVGVFTASGPAGFAVGQSVSPSVASWLGWPAVFVVYNVLSVAGLALFWSASRGLGRSSSGPAPTRAEFGDVLRNRSVWLVGTLGFLAYALYLFVNSWAPSYLTDEIGLSLGLSGLLVAVFPAVGILSRITGGYLSDRLFGGRRRPILVGSFLVAAPFLFALASVRSVGVLVVALLGAGFAIQLTLGLSFAYVRELVVQRVAATAVAFQTSLGLAGAFLSPIAGGALVESAGYEVAFLLTAGLALVGVAIAAVLPEP
jgi:predicted MFS family arabinose efflux permease